MATSFLKSNSNSVHNHVKLIHVVTSLRGFFKGSVLCGGRWILAMGLADLLGIADLHCIAERLKVPNG